MAANNTPTEVSAVECEVGGIGEVLTQPLQDYFFVFAVTGFIIAGLSVILGFCRKDMKYMRDRWIVLMLVTIVGWVFQLVRSPFRSSLDVPLNCILITLVQFLNVPFLGWPLVVRLIIWRNKIKYNYYIAKVVAESGLAKVSTDDDVFLKARFYASKNFGMYLTGGILLPYSIIAFLTAMFFVCTECDRDAVELKNRVFDFAVAGILLPITAWIIYNNYDVPDSTGVRKETIQSFVFPGIAVVSYALDSFNAGEFNTTPGSAFTFAIITDLAVFGYVFVMVILPILKSFCIKPKEHGNDSFDEILKNPVGLKYFQLYLATEFSLENILFYQAVQKFEDKYETLDHQDVGHKLIDLFITPGGALELNISDEQKKEYKKYKEDPSLNIEREAFTEPYDEAVKLMYSSSYVSFKSSDFYKLYNGEADADSAKLISSTGVSSYLTDYEENYQQFLF